MEEKCENRKWFTVESDICNIQLVAQIVCVTSTAAIAVESAYMIFIYNYIHFVQINDEFSSFLAFFSFFIGVVVNINIYHKWWSMLWVAMAMRFRLNACSKCLSNNGINKNYGQIEELMATYL